MICLAGRWEIQWPVLPCAITERLHAGTTNMQNGCSCFNKEQLTYSILNIWYLIFQHNQSKNSDFNLSVWTSLHFFFMCLQLHKSIALLFKMNICSDTLQIVFLSYSFLLLTITNYATCDFKKPVWYFLTLATFFHTCCEHLTHSVAPSTPPWGLSKYPKFLSEYNTREYGN